MKRILIAVAATLALSACGASHRPVVDTSRTDMNKYEKDVAECQAIADREAGAGTGAVIGALAGAALGEVFGRTGGAMRSRGHLAGAGAAGGAVTGASGATLRQKQIVSNCLRGRGHQVLD